MCAVTVGFFWRENLLGWLESSGYGTPDAS